MEGLSSRDKAMLFTAKHNRIALMNAARDVQPKGSVIRVDPVSFADLSNESCFLMEYYTVLLFFVGMDLKYFDKEEDALRYFLDDRLTYRSYYDLIAVNDVAEQYEAKDFFDAPFCLKAFIERDNQAYAQGKREDFLTQHLYDLYSITFAYLASVDGDASEVELTFAAYFLNNMKTVIERDADFIVDFEKPELV